MNKNTTFVNDDSAAGVPKSKKFTNIMADDFEGISHISRDSTSFFRLP